MKKCKHCGKYVEELYGLFVPHACKDCMDKIRQEDIDKKNVCGMCHKPYCDCYC